MKAKRRWFKRAVVVLLVITLGAFTMTIWRNRHRIVDIWNNLFLYYQD